MAEGSKDGQDIGNLCNFHCKKVTRALFSLTARVSPEQFVKYGKSFESQEHLQPLSVFSSLNPIGQ